MNVNMGTDAVHCLGSTFVPAVWVCMESGCRSTVTIVLNEIKLRAATSAARIAVLSDVVGEGDIDIVVDTTMSAAQIHVKLDETARKIVRSLRTCTGATMNGPATGRPLRAAIVCSEI